jgi:hypothetical protein
MEEMVYLWEPVPSALGNVSQELAKSKMSGCSVQLEIDMQEYLSSYDFFSLAAGKNKQYIQGTISPSEACVIPAVVRSQSMAYRPIQTILTLQTRLQLFGLKQ